MKQLKTNITDVCVEDKVSVKSAMRGIYSKAELYSLVDYLTFQTDKYAIGAHFYGDLDVAGRIKDFKNRTGKTPAYVDFDMNNLAFKTLSKMESAASELTDFAESGGFIAITDHWITPINHYSQIKSGCGANHSRGVLNREQYYEVMTDGTTLNKNFLSELEAKANFLKMLQANGVPVIFRPLHEGNASWFWWGIHEKEGINGEDTAELYRFVYRYFTEVCGIDNILWQFSTAINGCQSVLCDWYPGDNFIDILSLDWYLPENDYKGYYERMLAECGNKPFAVSEYGGDGNYNVNNYKLTETLSRLEAFLDKGANAAYVGLYFDMSEKQDWTLSSRAITLEQMSDFWDKSQSKVLA